MAHGLTQQQVADRWNELWPAADNNRPVTYKHISYWEAWPSTTGRAPSADALNKLARIYACGASDLLDGEDHTGLDANSSPADASHLGIATAPTPPDDAIPRVNAFIANNDPLNADQSSYHRLVEELIEWACRMRRRDVLQWLSWASASAAAAPIFEHLDVGERERTTLAIASPRRVDNAVVEHIEAVLWRCMRQDDALGPQAVLDTTLAQRNLVRTLLPDAAGPLRDRLLSLYANLSRFAGWLSFDLNNYEAASIYYESARQAAHEAHDTELGAFVLCNMSHLATWRGQPRIGIDHAVAAQGWAGQTEDARLQAYTADVTARAYTADGNARAAFTALDLARRSLDRVTSDPRPTSHAYFYDVGLFTSIKSDCHRRFGQLRESTQLAEAAVRQIDPSYARNLAFAIIDLGECQLSGGRPDIDAASSTIREAARLASQNRSVRLVDRLRSCWRRLEPWQHEPTALALRDELASYRLLG
ncbi:MAG: hypothetical protein HKP61_10405 [Dactylosporangium sp.]|nr:hypothetical protein [Dactylosporangium sp.]NNJ61340.1 hypothetical protein [Dactylosporangium sp.]